MDTRIRLFVNAISITTQIICLKFRHVDRLAVATERLDFGINPMNIFTNTDHNRLLHIIKFYYEKFCVCDTVNDNSAQRGEFFIEHIVVRPERAQFYLIHGNITHHTVYARH